MSAFMWQSPLHQGKLSKVEVVCREPHFEHVEWLIKWDLGALFAIPIIVFGFNCHPNVVTIFSELERHPSSLVPALPQR